MNGAKIWILVILRNDLIVYILETTFKKGIDIFLEATRNGVNFEEIEKALIELKSLISNPRLLALKTDRHRIVLFETYYYVAEILNYKQNDLQALKFYLSAVKINSNHTDTWFKIGELFWSTALKSDVVASNFNVLQGKL